MILEVDIQHLVGFVEKYTLVESLVMLLQIICDGTQAQYQYS